MSQKKKMQIIVFTKTVSKVAKERKIVVGTANENPWP